MLSPEISILFDNISKVWSFLSLLIHCYAKGLSYVEKYVIFEDWEVNALDLIW